MKKTIHNQFRVIKRRLRRNLFDGHCRATSYHGSRVIYHALEELKYKYHYDVVEMWERTGKNSWRYMHVY